MVMNVQIGGMNSTADLSIECLKMIRYKIPHHNPPHPLATTSCVFNMSCMPQDVAVCGQRVTR